MRIDRLDLTAFGPFTGASLDLSGGAEGLHVIFGPNEAGKSSALRAIRQLFCGVPRLSSDNFVHAYDKLRVGGLLRGRDGSSLELVRRKGTKNTLLASDGAPVDDLTLAAALGGTAPEDFTRRFVIDHPELVTGGRDLATGRGDFGRALFAAGGGGLARVGGVQKELDQEAEELFLPRGTKPTINADLKKLDEYRKELRESALPSSQWVAHDAALKRAQERRAEIDGERETAERDRNRLSRMADAVAPAARRRELLHALAGLADAPRLPDGFGFRLRSALSQLPASERSEMEARNRVKATTAELSRLEVPEAILDEADAIESLHSRLGGLRQAGPERDRLDAEWARLAVEARAALRELGRPPSWADEALSLEGDDDGPLQALRTSSAERARLGELAAQFESVPQAREAARKALAGVDDRRRDVAARLDALGPARDASPLRRALKAANQAGGLAAAIEKERQGLASDMATADAAIAALGRWSGPLEALEAPGGPTAEAVDAFQVDLDGVEVEHKDLVKSQEKARADARDADAGLDRLRLQGDVPTEDGLADARGRRDASWRAIRAGRSWDDAAADALEAAVRAADEAADRLRREADRVSERARLLAERGRLASALDDLEARLEANRSRRADWESRWSGAWAEAGVRAPGGPREMLAWLRKRAEISTLARSVREARARLAAIESKQAAVDAALTEALAALGALPTGPGPSLVDHAENVLEALTAADLERAGLAEESRRLEAARPALAAEAEAAEARLDDWRARWTEALARLGLGPDDPPSAMNAFLSTSADVFKRLEQARSSRRRAEALAREASQFAEDARDLAARVAPDLLGPAVPSGAWPSGSLGFDGPGMARPPGGLFAGTTLAEPEASDDDPAAAAGLAEALYRRLKDARAARHEREGLDRQLMEQRGDSLAAKADVEKLRAELTALRREARLADDAGHDELDAADLQDRRRRELEAELKAVEEPLRKLAAGTDLDAFAAEVADADPDLLGPRAAGLEQRITELQREADEASQAIGRETTELSRWKGGDHVAEIGERAESLRAKVKADVEQYVRLRLAAALLRQGVERYREKAQGPVLERASATFAALTLGSFSSLRVSYDEGDEPVLRGHRPDGGPVGVDGMSDGSADQLYLALRLATLEAHLDRREPLPLIVDDILIQFDDARAAATLEVLAAFSKRTQVIMFTHHEHLVDLARARLAPGVLFAHRLPGRNAC